MSEVLNDYGYDCLGNLLYSNTMKKINVLGYLRPAFWLFCVVVALALTGCAMEAPGETKAEVERRHERILENSKLQAQDDLDALMQTDRPSRLSDKVIR